MPTASTTPSGSLFAGHEESPGQTVEVDGIRYAGGRVLGDLKRVNYVVLGGENAGGHLFM